MVPSEEKGVRMSAIGELIEGLNTDLSFEYQAIMKYNQYAALVKGPHRLSLATFFRGEMPDELRHATFLADKIAALGGVPISEPEPFETTDDPKHMLEILLKDERDTIQRYKTRIEQADAIGDVGLRVELENIVSDETHHAEDLEQLLKGWG